MHSAGFTAGRYVVTLASFEALIGCKWELVILLVPPLPWKVFLQAGRGRAGVMALQHCEKGGGLYASSHIEALEFIELIVS